MKKIRYKKSSLRALNGESSSLGAFSGAPIYGSVPKVKHWIDLSTLHRFLSEYQIQDMQILDKDGNVLMSANERYFLNGRDERQRFVSELSKACNTLKEAYDSMKPRIVKKAEGHGLKVKRQGELFFVPISEAFGTPAITDIQKPIRKPEKRYRCRKCGRKDVASFNHSYILDYYSDNPCEGKSEDVEEYETYTIERPTIKINDVEFRQHTATRIGKYYGTIQAFTVVKGVIRHTFGQHRQLNLGDQWHIVAKNVVVRSISVGGGAD